MSVLVLNVGSSSIKYELFEDLEDAALRTRAEGEVEGIGGSVGGMRAVTITPDGPRTEQAQTVFADHSAALSAVMAHLKARSLLRGLRAVGHRMVHGGERFTAPTLLDDQVLAHLDGLSSLAPLHNPPAIEGIRIARDLQPDVPHVAVFDTAFHATLSPEAYRYAVPGLWYADHGVRRYGFHGTSHAYVSDQAALALDRPLQALRLVSLHLGNGASACAVQGGRSVDTSMGMTPLEGLVMGTRSGDLDPGVVLHMLRAGLDVEQMDAALNRGSGLLGLAGDNDVRTVEQMAADGDPDAELALAVMTRRIRGVIGSYLAHLGGLDAVVFTAGVGEHSATVRASVIGPLGHLGLHLDEQANATADATQGPVIISPPGPGPAVLVVATDEERRIAEETVALLG